jgi:hypothetical protein
LKTTRGHSALPLPNLEKNNAERAVKYWGNIYDTWLARNSWRSGFRGLAVAKSVVQRHRLLLVNIINRRHHDTMTPGAERGSAKRFKTPTYPTDVSLDSQNTHQYQSKYSS